jgi:hypothetical protein
MKSLIGFNATPMQCTSLSPSAPIWQDILAQAMTGELLAAMNYISLSESVTIPQKWPMPWMRRVNEGTLLRSLSRAAGLGWTSPTMLTPGTLTA